MGKSLVPCFFVITEYSSLSMFSLHNLAHVQLIKLCIDYNLCSLQSLGTRIALYSNPLNLFAYSCGCVESRVDQGDYQGIPLGYVLTEIVYFACQSSTQVVTGPCRPVIKKLF